MQGSPDRADKKGLLPSLEVRLVQESPKNPKVQPLRVQRRGESNRKLGYKRKKTTQQQSQHNGGQHCQAGYTINRADIGVEGSRQSLALFGFGPPTAKDGLRRDGW